MSAPSLGVLVVARNEEARLPACLESVAGVDRVLVVLDRCTDGTKSVAEAHGAAVLEGAWPTEGARRNAGLAAIGTDWVLELDADERATPALLAEIRAALPGTAMRGFSVPFDNRIGGRPVRHGWGAYNGVARKTCLVARGAKVWGDQLVHPALQQEKPVGRLENPIVHLVDEDIADMMARLNRYSSLAAQELVNSGERPPLRPAFRRFAGRFWKSYVSREGWREGTYGLALGLFSALYPLLTVLKARERLDRQDTGKTP